MLIISFKNLRFRPALGGVRWPHVTLLKGQERHRNLKRLFVLFSWKHRRRSHFRLVVLRFVLDVLEQREGLPVEQQQELGQVGAPQGQAGLQQEHLERRRTSVQKDAMIQLSFHILPENHWKLQWEFSTFSVRFAGISAPLSSSPWRRVRLVLPWWLQQRSVPSVSHPASQFELGRFSLSVKPPSVVRKSIHTLSCLFLLLLLLINNNLPPKNYLKQLFNVK